MPDANRSNNLLLNEMASGTIDVTVPSLALGGTVSSTVADGQDIYYQVAIPAGHDIIFTAASDVAGAAELYVRYGDMPSPSLYDQFAFNANSQQQLIGISGATQGTYYILVHGREAAGTGQPLTLSVQDAPFSLVGVSTAKANTGVPFTTTLTGFQFSAATTAVLVDSTGTQIDAQSVTYVNRNTLYATFQVPLFADGVYSVLVQQGTLTPRWPT